MSNDRALIVHGPFTEDELREVAEAVRLIEQRHPNEVYHVMWSDDEASIASSIAQVMNVFPRLAGQSPNVVIVKKPSTERN